MVSPRAGCAFFVEPDEPAPDHLCLRPVSQRAGGCTRWELSDSRGRALPKYSYQSREADTEGLELR